MHRIATINGTQVVQAAGQGQLAGRLARRVQHHASQFLAAFENCNGARSRHSIRPGYAHLRNGPGLPALLALGYGQRSLSRNAACCALRQAAYACRKRKRHSQSCNQTKPQTAAVHASHVHLLQFSRKIAYRLLLERRNLLYPARVRWGHGPPFDFARNLPRNRLCLRHFPGLRRPHSFDAIHPE